MSLTDAIEAAMAATPRLSIRRAAWAPGSRLVLDEHRTGRWHGAGGDRVRVLGATEALEDALADDWLAVPEEGGA